MNGKGEVKLADFGFAVRLESAVRIELIINIRMKEEKVLWEHLSGWLLKRFVVVAIQIRLIFGH